MGALGKLPAPGHPRKAWHGLSQQAQCDGGSSAAGIASSVVADQVDRGPVGASSAPVDAVVVLCCNGESIVPVVPVDPSQVSLVVVVCSAQGPAAAVVVWAA